MVEQADYYSSLKFESESIFHLLVCCSSLCVALNPQTARWQRFSALVLEVGVGFCEHSDVHHCCSAAPDGGQADAAPAHTGGLQRVQVLPRPSLPVPDQRRG